VTTRARDVASFTTTRETARGLRALAVPLGGQGCREAGRERGGKRGNNDGRWLGRPQHPPKHTYTYLQAYLQAEKPTCERCVCGRGGHRSERCVCGRGGHRSEHVRREQCTPGTQRRRTRDRKRTANSGRLKQRLKKDGQTGKSGRLARAKLLLARGNTHLACKKQHSCLHPSCEQHKRATRPRPEVRAGAEEGARAVVTTLLGASSFCGRGLE
jgi:hypothetical protein